MPTRSSSDKPPRVLILGGSSEASQLARMLADADWIEPTLSLAGRTATPALPPIPYRIGGFSGAEGLAAYLRDHAVDLVVDATHPFAERMSANAEAACRAAAVPLIVLERPPWTASPGDRWTETADMAQAARAIGSAPRRVFLTVGRQLLSAFESAPQHHYLARTIDPPQPIPALPHLRLLHARGPFSLADETRLLREEKIEVVITKNSGGDAARAKLDAARALAIPVILIRRPPAAADAFNAVEPLLAELRRRAHAGGP